METQIESRESSTIEVPPTADQRLRNYQALLRANARLLFAWLSSYALLALMLVQPESGIDLKWHWASTAVFACLGASLARATPRAAYSATLTVWSVALGVVSLLTLWQSGASSSAILLGLHPYSDAFGYYQDAQRILAGYSISTFSGRRPMFASLLAGLLRVTGNDLRAALIVLVALASASIGWVSATLGRNLVSTVFFVCSWLFYRKFVGSTLTETLGFPLGLLAFAALWRAATSASQLPLAAGLFALALALNARAGAFFVLPALIFWACALRTGRFVFSPKALAVAASAVVAGFALNRLLGAAMGAPTGAAFSNFSYVLYGLLRGQDWMSAMQEHPYLADLEEVARANEITRLAMEMVRADPTLLIRGSLRALIEFIPRMFSFAALTHIYAPHRGNSLVLTILSLPGLWLLYKKRDDPRHTMMIAALVGTVASVPFAPPWDADAMRAYAATIAFLIWLPAAGAAVWWHSSARTYGEEGPRQGLDDGRIHVVVAAVVLALCVALPLTVSISTPRSAPGSACGEAQVPASSAALPGTAVVMVDESPSAGMQGRHTLGERGLEPRAADVHKFADSGFSPSPLIDFVQTLPREGTVFLTRVIDQRGVRVERIVTPKTSGLRPDRFRRCLDRQQGEIPAYVDAAQ